MMVVCGMRLHWHTMLAIQSIDSFRIVIMNTRKLKHRTTRAAGQESRLLRMLRWTVIGCMLLLPMRGFGQGHGTAQSPHEAPRVGEISGTHMRRPGDIVQAYHPSPALWERQVQDAFENKGVAKIVSVAARVALATYCYGIHTTYIHEGQAFTVWPYLGKFVRVRYRYIKVRNPNIRCVRAPCPQEEVRIIIESIEEITVSEEEQTQYTTTCVDAP